MDSRCWKHTWSLLREPGAGFIHAVHFLDGQICWNWGFLPSEELLVTMDGMDMHRHYPPQWLHSQLRLYAGLSGESWTRTSELQMFVGSTCWVLADVTFDLRSAEPREWVVEETWTSCVGRPLTVSFVTSTSVPLFMLAEMDSCCWKNTWSLLREPGSGFIHAVHVFYDQIWWQWGLVPTSELLVTTSVMEMRHAYPPQWLHSQLRLYEGSSGESWKRSSDLQMFVASTCWVLVDVTFDLRSAHPREWKVDELWMSGLGRPLTVNLLTGYE
jgi:hypothetical protein